MNAIRIEFAHHKRTIHKNKDDEGQVNLTVSQNYNDEHGPFKLCATDDSALDGLECTVCIEAFHTYDEAVTAALNAVSVLSANEQKRTERHVREFREAGLALEVTIAKNVQWTNRKLEIDRERQERRRLGYE